jgi:hypothetical protein
VEVADLNVRPLAGKLAYNVFIAVLFGKKVVLCAVDRNSDMMSDFLHRGKIHVEAL